MNDDENITGPQPWLDPALEARVVADALGETSAFEAAELHRLMEDNPELAIFKRRIEAVHALVGVAIRPEQPKIRMSPDRRQKLLEAIGMPVSMPEKNRGVLIFPRPAWFSSRNLIRVAASLVIGAILIASSMMIFKDSKRRLVAGTSGISDPASSPIFLGESGSFASADRGSALASSTPAVARQLVVQDGLTTTESRLQKDAPVGADFAMAVPPPARNREVEEIPPTPTTPTVVIGTTYSGVTSVSSGGLIVPNSSAAPESRMPEPQEMAKLELGAQKDAEDKISPTEPQSESMGLQEVEKRLGRNGIAKAGVGTGSWREGASETTVANELAAATDDLRSATAEASGKSDAYAMQAPAAPVAMAQMLANDSMQQPQELKKEVWEEGQPAEQNGRSKTFIIDRSLAMNAEKAKTFEDQLPQNADQEPHGTTRASGEKFDGYINYGSPIARPEAATAMTANGTGTLAVNQPTFSTRTAAAPAGRESAEPGAALQDEDQAKMAPTTIRAFTGGWAKGTGAGGGVAKAADRAQFEHTDVKEKAVVEEDIKLNGGSLGMDSNNYYMFRGVNVAGQANADNSTPAGPSLPMEKGDAKPIDLMSAPVVTTMSGQRATVAVVADRITNEKEEALGDKDSSESIPLGVEGSANNTKQLKDEAQHYYDSGRYDLAFKRYEQVLNVDKSDAAALKGVEQVNKARANQQDEAYNEARRDKVKQVNNAWELPVRKFNEIPSQNIAQPEEIKTTKQPFSTFSLHVSDVSFQLAKDALARGTMPDPERIRAEEFYNAFDYNDPSPAAGEELACRIEQSAHPFLQQRNLVRIALKVAAAGREAGQPLRLTLLLDTSGSMEREDRAASVRKAIQTLATLLGPNDRVTLIGFARTPRLLAEQVPGDQAGKLVEIAAHTPSEGGTNLEQALALASELALKQKLPAAQNRIVLLTDGAANLGNADPARLARQIEKTRQQGISFDACGVGANGLNDEMLEALTRKGDGRYYFLNRPEDAGAGFAQQLAGALRPAAENVKVQVHFNPDRVGQYRLIGFEKHLLKKEDFRNDKVGAAELSAEEAGVAVYQVETLPDGEGDLGQVFVRFRDPATGSMVERAWTMPYDPKAPAFDQASPSMQLAATSALIAEKLRGNSEIDLNTLSPVTNSLRGHFPNQRKVAELLQMIERLRQ